MSKHPMCNIYSTMEGGLCDHPTQFSNGSHRKLTGFYSPGYSVPCWFVLSFSVAFFSACPMTTILVCGTFWGAGLQASHIMHRSLSMQSAWFNISLGVLSDVISKLPLWSIQLLHSFFNMSRPCLGIHSALSTWNRSCTLNGLSGSRVNCTCCSGMNPENVLSSDFGASNVLKALMLLEG